MFEIAAFSRHLDGEGNKAAISKLRSFLTELRRSYIDFTLALKSYILSNDFKHSVLFIRIIGF